MAGKRYSAGAIFLQVVPVFANVQRAIEDEAKNIDRALGDQMERSGERAGERAGKAASKKMNEELAKGSGQFERDFHKNVEGINRALEGINTNRLSNGLRREIAQIKAELRSLGDVDITADADFRRVYADLAVLEGRLRGMRDDVKIVFRADVDRALTGIAKVQAAREAIEDDVEIEVRVDSGPALREMSSFEKSFKKTADKAASHLTGAMSREGRRLRDELKYLHDLRIGVDISSTQALRELDEIQEELRSLAIMSPDIDVRVESARAMAELAAFRAQIRELDGQEIDINVDTDRIRRASGLMGALGLQGDNASNAFRSFNVVLLAATSIGPALIPILGGIAGGLLAIGPAAGVAAAGLGSVLVGFSGVGDAVQALGQNQEQAARTTEATADRMRSASYAVADAKEALADAERNAAEAAEDAAERVADAREAAAEAIEDALDRQKEAQERYADSVQDVKDAEQALRDARAEAAGTGQELDRSIRDNQLAIDQALLDSFNATVEFNAVMADGSATNAEQEQARIDMEEAKLRLEELRAEQKELAEEKKKWDEQGVEGTEGVQNAQDDLTAAIEAQQDAMEELGEASAAVDEARADSAERVRDALEAQRESAEDAARAIRDAQQNLARAQEGYNDALEETSTQQAAVNEAFEKLGPAGQKFALFLHSLRAGFRDFRDDVQAVMLPAVQEAMEGFLASPSAAIARDALIGIAAAFGRFVEALSASFQGDAWTGFFEMLAELGPPIFEAYGDAFISFMEAMASMMTTAAPFALQFAEGFASMMDSFAKWAESKEGQESLLRFLEWVSEVGPSIMDFFGAFVDAFVALGIALAPWGTQVMKGLTAFFDFIAEMDPKLLGIIATGLILAILISQVAYGIASLIGGLSLLLTPLGAIVFAVAAAVAIFLILWNTNEDFRAFVIKAWDEISAAFSDAWEKYIKPALDDLWAALTDLWEQVLAPFFAWLGPILVKVAKFLIPLLAVYFATMARTVAWLIRNILIPVLRFIGTALKWVWENVIRPTLNFFRDHWDDVIGAIKWTWEHILRPVWNAVAAAGRWLWEEILRPAFTAIGTHWDALMTGMEWVWENILEPVFDWIGEKALPALVNSFEVSIGLIQAIWDGLREWVANPIRFVLEKVINEGLIDGFNEVASWVGMDGIGHIPVPGFLKFATGGIMPGYTPGRDVHSFVSPTAGRLELSGGEAVMRPEWTAAVGPDYIHHMNALARKGGVNAIRRANMGGYWMGGVLPLPGGTFAQHTSGYPGFAGDLNWGSGYQDYGKAVKAWRDGIVAQMNYVGDRSYGRWAILNHAAGQSSLYAHLSSFAKIAIGQAVKAGQTIGYVGDIGNTGEPPTSHLHFEINGGAVDYSDTATGGGGGRSIPGWLMSVIKDPLGAVKGWITNPLNAASDLFKGPVFDVVTKVPALVAEKTTDKLWDIIPGWAKTAAGWAGDAAEFVVGGVKNAAGAAADAAAGVAGAAGDAAGAVGDFFGLARGGILPYNGTMMYDNGGYLPPGLTTVVNLTGKPEPVFTADQFASMEAGGVGGNIHYEPHFEGSNLTAEDVAGDLNFTFRRMRRAGKYEGVGAQ